LWNALAYHAAFFARINPAAGMFAAAFVLEALLFAFAARRSDADFFTSDGWRRQTGIALIIYAFAYPILNLTLGHEYPGTPTFGVPCPTAILTLGLLLTMRARAARWLFVVPILWGFVAGWAAVVLNVWTDYVLVLAAIVAAAGLVGGLNPRSREQRVHLRMPHEGTR
jgi:hypothetical protein